MVRIQLLASLVPILALAACVPRAEPPPPPPPAPTPAPAPAPVEPAPIAGDWRDLPLTPGNWVYRRDERGSTALFGRAGGEAEFSIHCDRGAGRVVVSRRGPVTAGAAMTIRTSSMARALPLRPTAGMPAYVAAALPPRDPVLDAMGFSRGRFVVAVPSVPQLVVPAWAEILRVTEDCRA